jgi:hypothetical protein
VTGEIIEEGEDRVIDVLSYEVLTAEIKEGQEEEIEESDEKSVQDKQ